jgi:predicted peroxiredoxin
MSLPFTPKSYQASWPTVITAADTTMRGGSHTIATFVADPYSPTGYNPQQQVWYANGRWWVSYSDSQYSYFDSTADEGVTWKGATILRNFTSGQARGYKDGIWWDEATSYVYYTACGNSNSGGIYWIRGTCNADGTITWGVQRQLSDTPASTYKSYPTTCKDTDGYPWVGFMYSSGTYYPAATKASATDGSTWNAGVAVDATIATGVGLPPMILPLASGNMLLAYISGNNYFFKTYDGAAWDANATTITTTANSTFFAVNNGNTVYFLYGDTGGDIKLRKYVHGVGLSAEETVVVAPTTFRLALSYDSANDICYIFWTTEGRYLNMMARASDGTYGPSYQLFDELYDAGIECLVSSFNVQNTSEVMVCYETVATNLWTIRAFVIDVITHQVLWTEAPPGSLIFTAGANGSHVDEIKIKALGTNIQTTVRIFVNDGGSGYENYSLIYERTIAATTLDQDIEMGEFIFRPDYLNLPAGYRLYATIGTAVAAGIEVTVVGGDY